MALNNPDNRPIALVTGGSRGIGRAIAEDLGRDHHVLVGATTYDGAHAVASLLPSAGEFVVDLTDVEAVSAELKRTLGDAPLDVIVHSAGVFVGGNVEDIAYADWVRILDVNVAAVAELTRQTLPALRAANGIVVTINSGSGFRASPGSAAYAASKFALRAFTDALREEERGNVRVTSVHPGRVDTDMQVAIQGEEGYDGSKYVTPSSIAKAVRLAVDAGMDCSVDEVQVRPRK
ncbi:SDR family oxidoreductase [Corynebacterium sp. H78]|uniref:SDR family oxidoreductase n=1 Tax=Corynebacterium sp. H78 TaxID=3133417 RepID=UPI00309A3CDC